MSSNYSATCIEFKTRASRQLTWLLAGFHALAAVVILLSVPYRPAAAALLLLTFLSWYRANRVHIQRRGNQALRRIVWKPDGRWQVDDIAGITHDAELLPSSYLHRRLVILNFLLAGGQRRNLVLLPDSLEPSTLRQLRARLRIESVTERRAAISR